MTLGEYILIFIGTILMIWVVIALLVKRFYGEQG